MMDLVEKIVEIKAETDMLIKENREMVNVEKVVTELLKEINWHRVVSSSHISGSIAEHKELALFQAIRIIADVSGKEFKIITNWIDGPNGTPIIEFSFDDTPPMLEPKF
tara:strand:- start:442 stop:768 length:327 start_codon:yes stop_codon:yes gene_type:complete